jgi:hypothetical protein
MDIIGQLKTTTHGYHIMGNKEKRKELRKYQRLYTQQGAVAALEESKFSLKVGLIANISKSGLAFCYLDQIKIKDEPNETINPVISWNVSDFFMDKIPCKVVSDEKITISSSSSACTLPMRFCRIQFGELAPHQFSKLEDFIEDFTKDPTND